MSLKRVCACGVIATLAAACGSRTGPLSGEASALDSGVAEVAPDLCASLDCDDRDPCTNDTCTAGVCAHAPVTPDVDGDGHHAPLPGTTPGAPGSCGDDCNDSSAAAFPGAKEICDGVDNDCNGIVDDGARYVPQDPTIDAVLVSGPIAPTDPASVAFSGSSYLASYTGTVGGKIRAYDARLAPDGSKVAPEAQLNAIEADSFGAIATWTGAEYGVAWNDRRDDWAVFFSRLDANGQKLLADEKVSEDTGEWAIDQSIAWTGTEYVLAWSDGRDAFPIFYPYAQRLDVAGNKIGPNIRLSNVPGETPSIAIGTSTIGMTWTHVDDTTEAHSIVFALFDRTLKQLSSRTVTLPGTSGVYARVVWNQGTYVVVWFDQDETPHAVYATTLDESGSTLTPVTEITESPRFSRYPTMLPLGDRLLLVWSDTKDQNDGYELYSKLLDRKLAPLGDELRITFAKGDSVFPEATFGPNGDVGILFRDDRAGETDVYFTRLVCKAGS